MIEGLPSVCLKHIDVEEPVSFEIHTRENIVIERYLSHIDVLGIACSQEHPVIEEHVAHRSASLVVCILVRKHVGRSEALDARNRAETSIDMYLLVCDIMPDSIQGRIEGCIACIGNDIRHAGIKVKGTHGMAHRLALLAHRHMLLRIIDFRISPLSPYVDELLRHIKVKLLPCCLIHLYQRQLYLLMARSLIYRLAVVIRRITLEEHLIDMSRVLLRHIQPFPLACRLIICYRRLIHMTHIIKLMTMKNVGIRSVSRSAASLIHGLRNCQRLIQIAILALRVSNDVDNLVHPLFKLGIGLERQQVGRTFHDLEEVGSDVTRKLLHLLLPACLEILAYETEVLHCRLCLFERERHKSLLLCLQSREPEIILEAHLLEGQGPERLVGLYDILA